MVNFKEGSKPMVDFSSRRGAIPWPDSKVRTSAKTISNNHPVKGCCPNQFWTLHWEQCFTVKLFHIIFHFRNCFIPSTPLQMGSSNIWQRNCYEDIDNSSGQMQGRVRISKWDPCCSNCAVTPTHAISLVTLAILHSDCWLGKQQGETCIHTPLNFENIIVGIWCIMLCCSNAMCALYANPLIWRSIIVRSSRYYPALEKDQSVDPYLTLAPHEPSSGPNMAP